MHNVLKHCEAECFNATLWLPKLTYLSYLSPDKVRRSDPLFFTQCLVLWTVRGEQGFLTRGSL